MKTLLSNTGLSSVVAMYMANGQFFVKVTDERGLTNHFYAEDRVQVSKKLRKYMRAISSDNSNS